LLAFQPVADGKNSRRPKLETGHSTNDVNAVEALCYRRCRILFFQKNPSPGAMSPNEREACCRERCRDRTNTRHVGTQSNGYSEAIAIINR
jgi:hypothetical protein